MNFQLAKYSLLKKFSENIGFTTPEECGAIFKYLIENVKTDRQIIYSPHCHDDLGMAVANSLAAVKNGAGRVEETINGIRERAENAALEEIAVALNIRQDYYQTPELVGVKIPLGKLSGRHAFVEKLRELALDFTEEDIKPLFAKFKALADKK